MLKNVFKRVIFYIIGVLLCTVLFMPGFINERAMAESEPAKYSLLAPDFKKEGVDISEKYNISDSQTVPFQPFDFENKKRQDGLGFKFNSSEKNKIENQYILVEGEHEIENENNSLFFWVYFDNIYLHNLSLTLEFKSGDFLTWNISSTKLADLIKEYSSVNLSSLPYAWRLIELPFSCGQMTGDIYEQGKLKDINKMIVNYSSSESILKPDGKEVIDEYSTLIFYDIYISQSSNEEIAVTNKQKYRIFDFNFFSDEIINGVCVGDKLKTPTNAVNYAWNGTDDLTKISTVRWRVVVREPNSDSVKYLTFGDEIDFEKEGTYQIYYECLDIKYSNTQPIISDGVEIEVTNLRAIYFDKKTYNIEVGKTYFINLYTSSKLKDVSDFSFSCNSDEVTYSYKGNGVLEVKANSSGSFSIDVSVEAKRPISSETKKYTNSIKVVAEKPKNENYQVFKIVLWSILGVFGIICIILIVKMLVKSRKINVK